MKKIERILAIIVLLLENDVITTSELAEKFDVSKRTIFRDIQTIENAGFPISSSYGRNGGISLIDSFKLRSLSFTEVEKKLILDSLVINEKIIGETIEPSVLKEKVRLLANVSLEDQSLSLGSPTVHRAAIEHHIYAINKQIRQAMNQKLKAVITYIDGQGEQTTRTVEPHELGLFNGSWFLRAYCEKRQAFRFFKVTRIISFALTSEKFNLRIDDKVDLTPSKEFQIKLEFKKVMLGKLYDYYLDDELQIFEDKIRVHFSSSSIEETATYLLRFHGNVVILEPDELKQEYTRIIQKINNSLNDDI
ncbi:helix-turn-helix transcriptional regulator [Enterococcus sp. DIV0187]|uniref:helix-turn-helix transcriptional regulator n=1 Tax=Enterococcus sp. DIV0187 TaxID=2774644 RepID=UPI003F228486